MTPRARQPGPAATWRKLVQLAKARGEDPNFALMRFAAERLLYRLSVSAHAANFVLKGAMLFAAWTDKPHRSTRDVDLLGFGSPDALITTFGEVCAVEVSPDDGVRFDAGSIRTEAIRDEEQYEGRRLVVSGSLGKLPVRVQVDVGFGDAVTPAATTLNYPVLLPEFPGPVLRTYPPESVVAEKFEAMVKLGLANSRMKDFYDLWVLSRTRAFDAKVLHAAARATFARRGTPWPVAPPVALTADFSEDATKVAQWGAFLERTRAAEAPALREVVERLAVFLRIDRRGGEGTIWSPQAGAWTGDLLGELRND
ncbi:MAG: hypothetical protein RL653_2213 [Pseudomonadota bacterium]|jgi:predicted nucleotidyltransferase component of viral defense system